jgi:hypothetical protein
LFKCGPPEILIIRHAAARSALNALDAAPPSFFQPDSGPDGIHPEIPLADPTVIAQRPALREPRPDFCIQRVVVDEYSREQVTMHEGASRAAE